MADILSLLGTLSSWIWGLPLIALLIGTGIILTVALRGIQFRKLGYALWLALFVRKEEGAEGDISHFQALMTALAATVGVGNIAGVATAIAAGGPGALFWMWMTGFFGMATKYSEALLGVKFRVTNAEGTMSGGPMYYLEKGVGGKFGRFLAMSFALFAVFASFGIGNMVQSNSVADALRSSFGIPPWLSGIVLAVSVGLVILGGIKSIGRFTGFFVPLMIGFYLLGSVSILFLEWRQLDDVFQLIIKEAFTPAAPMGAFAGALVKNAIRWGFARGIFSNESGLGTGAIAAAAAQTKKPASQALVSMTQTFIDTIIVCSLTGFVIIVTGAYGEIDPTTGAALTGAPLTMHAFNTALPGAIGGMIVSLGLTFFAFSTILGWAYYGERAIEYLTDARAIKPYRAVFVTATLVGAGVLHFGQVAGLQIVWAFSDIMNGAMAIPNLIGLIILTPLVVRETRQFFEKPEK
ncbi:sodium:alanine symporter family protein [Myxococcota bacterium]|nr:sodium:alanine symporter family protein [Myxococcota bacterium]